MRLVVPGRQLVNLPLLSPAVIQTKAAGDHVADACRNPFAPTGHPELARRQPKRTGEFRAGPQAPPGPSVPLREGSDAV